MTAIVTDTFTDKDATPLLSHTPDLGFGWDVVGPGAFEIRGNRLHMSATGIGFAQQIARLKASSASDGGYPTGDYMVTGVVDFLSGPYIQEVYITARASATTIDCYALGWYRGNQWVLSRYVDGYDQPYRFATLATSGYPTGQHTLKLIVWTVGGVPHLAAQIDGVTMVNTTETAWPALLAGPAGVIGQDIDQPSQPNGTWLTSLSVDPIPTTPDHLAILRQPAGILPATPFGVLPKILVANVQGLAVTGAADTVTIAKLSGPGALTGTLTASVDTTTGIATFAGPMQISVAGDYVFGFTDSLGLTATQSLSIHVPATATATFAAPLLNADMTDAGMTALDGGATWELRSGAPPAMGSPDTGTLGASGAFGTFGVHNFAGVCTACPPAMATAVASIAPGYLVLKTSGGTPVMRVTAGPSGVMTTPASLTNGQRVQFDWMAIQDSSQLVTIASVVSGGMSFGGTMDGPAELPRVIQSRTLTARSTGTLRTVGSGKMYAATGAGLQQAIDDAGADDWIVVDNSSDITPAGGGQLLLRNKGTLAKPIVIIAASVPAAGTRMTPTLAASLASPKLRLANTLAGVMCENGADNYRLVGIEVCPAAVSPPGAVFMAVCFGPDPSQPVFGQGPNAAATPSRMWLDRCYVHGTDGTHITHGVAMNSHAQGCIDSWISAIHNPSAENHAIIGWMGNGPTTVVNNYAEAESENIFFGGSESNWGHQPADLEIRYNTIAKDPAWHGTRFFVKTLMECKTGTRVLVEGNDLLYCWEAGQQWYGSSMTFKTVNQGGSMVPSWRLSDLTCRFNRVQFSGSLFNFHPMPEYRPCTAAARVSCHDNMAIHVGEYPATGVRAWAIFLGSTSRYGTTDADIAHLTYVSRVGGGVALFFDNDETLAFKTTRTNVRDCLIGTLADYPLQGAAHGYVDDTLAAWWGTATSLFTHNVISCGFTGPRSSAQALLNTWLTNTSDTTFPELHFTNIAADDYSLVAGSTYSATGTTPASDGLDVGCNITALNSALAGGTPFTPPNPAVASTLQTLTAPVGAVAGQPLSTQPVFRELDQFGAAFSATGSVTVTRTVVSGGVGSVLGGTTTRAFSGSTATFTDLSLNVAGVYTLTATDGYGHTVTTGPITVTAVTSSGGSRLRTHRFRRPF